jgi:hypothetical protein
MSFVVVYSKDKKIMVKDRQDRQDLKFILQAFETKGSTRGAVVEEITRVRNPILEERYFKTRERMRSEHKEKDWGAECLMFHGTSQENIGL